jgi:hypothetical protein
MGASCLMKEASWIEMAVAEDRETPSPSEWARAETEIVRML